MLSPTLIALAIAAILGSAIATIIARRPPVGRAPRATASPSPEPRPGGRLAVVASEDVDSLDPQRAGRPSSWFFVRALHRGLLAFPNRPFPEGARPVPDLAASMPEVSADGLRYTFRLRADARFGPPASRPVRGPDVKAGLERLKRSGGDAARGLGVVRAIKAAALTVVLELSRPSNDVPWVVALPQASAVPRELRGRLRVRPESIAPSGPYRVAEYVAERRIRLVRNPEWRAASDPVRRALVDEIVADLDVEPARQVERIAARRADLSLEAPPAGRLPRLAGAQVVGAPNGCLRYVWMNTTVEPFSDPRVRRALSIALDRAALAGVHGEAAARPAGRILPPTVFGSRRVAVPPPRPSQAAALLGRAGARGAAGTLVASRGDLDRRQAGLVARQARRAGLRLSVRTVPEASVYTDHYEIPARRVPAGIATWCADWPGLGGRAVLGALLDTRAVTPRGNTVYSMLDSPTLRRLIDAALRARSERAAQAGWETADRYAVRQAAVVPVAWLEEISVVGTRVRGFVPHALFARGDPTNVWLDGS